MELEKKLIFSHLPKCGGTSIRASFIEYFGEEKVLFHWNDPFENSKYIHFLRRLYYYPILKKNTLNKKLIFGHFSFNDIPKIKNSSLVTFIRDPIEIFGSMYFYAQRKYKDKSPKDYIEFAKYKNFGTIYKKFFGNLDIKKIDFIGSLEDYSDSISRLNKKFNLNLKTKKVNTNPSSIKDYKSFFKEENVYKKLIEINKENIEIYNNLKNHI